MPQCAIKYKYRGLKDCPNDADYVVFLMAGGEDWFLCEKHFQEVKKSGYLDNLISHGRVKKLKP